MGTRGSGQLLLCSESQCTCSGAGGPFCHHSLVIWFGHSVDIVFVFMMVSPGQSAKKAESLVRQSHGVDVAPASW